MFLRKSDPLTRQPNRYFLFQPAQPAFWPGLCLRVYHLLRGFLILIFPCQIIKKNLFKNLSVKINFTFIIKKPGKNLSLYNLHSFTQINYFAWCPFFFAFV